MVDDAELLERERRRRLAGERLIAGLGVIEAWSTIGEPAVEGAMALEVVVNRDIDIEVTVAEIDLARAVGVWLQLRAHPAVVRGSVIERPEAPFGGTYFLLVAQDEDGNDWSIETWVFPRDRQARPSLSPVSLLSLGSGDRIVLPSPNGSSCAALASEMGATVVAGCLRNASSIGAWLNGRADTITVIACGERWSDGTLRPSLEDYLGAGAVIAALGGSRSPEAAAAAEAWLTAAPRVNDVVSSCASGKEPVARGWGRDLEFALSVDVSHCVPVLRDGFVDARSAGPDDPTTWL